jgi:hypothetical protein
MDMIARDLARYNIQLMLHRNLAQEISGSYGYLWSAPHRFSLQSSCFF